MTTQAIYYLDALAGAGKTHALIPYAVKQARQGRKVLIVQPTKELIKRTIADELEPLCLPGDRVAVYHGDREKHVVASLMAHFRDTQPGGEIVFTTQAAFLRASYLDRRHQWIAIFDEAPQVDHYAEPKVPHTHHLLTDLLEAEPHNVDYARLKPRKGCGAEVGRIARNTERDEVLTVFETLAAHITSPHRDVYVLDDQWCDLKSGLAKRHRLTTFSLLKPSIVKGFKRVIIASALFTNTLLYRLWVRDGVKFRSMSMKGLRYSEHQNGGLLTIRYAVDGDWSKTLRNRIEEGQTRDVGERIIEAVAAHFGAQPFLWMGNKDADDWVFGSAAQATRLPNTPHGRNDYQGVHNTVVLSALNPTPAHFAFLESYGVSSDEVRTSLYRSAVYQAVMRSSLRNPADLSPKEVVVMDSVTAHWLADLFSGATVTRLHGVEISGARKKAGRRKLHVSDAARKAAHRQEKEIELLIEQEMITGDELAASQYPDLTRRVREQMSELRFATKLPYRGDYVAFVCPVFASIYDKESLGDWEYADHEDFISGLKSFQERVLEDKHSAGMASPALFDPAMDEVTSRGTANIRHVTGVWLDNDGGELTPEEFARLFPRLRMAIFNTFSSTPEVPRWRVYIPTTTAMSIRVHRLIVGEIMAKLAARGWRSKAELTKNPRLKGRHHGFDMSKLTPSSLFYLPSQAKAGVEATFFLDLTTTPDGKPRKPIEPVTAIKRSVRALRADPEPVRTPVVANCAGGSEKLDVVRAAIEARQDERQAVNREWHVAEAIRVWRSSTAIRGTGHREFWMLRNRLRAAGLEDHELEARLWSEANYARSPDERRAEIRGLVRRG
jgi:hypothetical protein